MRCLILAIDSLEYEIAKNFPHLRQKEFGKTIVPIYKGQWVSMPFTPMVWASFITGLSPRKHQVSGPIATWDNSILERLSEFWEKERRKFGLPDLKWMGHALETLSFEKAWHQNTHSSKEFKAKNILTIFDHAKKPIVISVPSYNEEQIYDYLRRRLSNVLTNRLSENILEEEAREAHYKKVQKILEKLDEDWDLFMVHLYIVDIYGHMFPNYDLRVKRLYKELDNLVAKIKKKIHDTLFLIVSDHGHQSGHHTNYGFYSSNEILGLHYPEITDFYQIILEALAC